MKICLFSDMHGNGPAFRAAFGMIIDEAADLHIFLGDLCGYYYDQIEILGMLKKMPNLAAVKGNHDAMFLDIVAGNEHLRENYVRKYGHSMEHLLKGDIKDIVDWLALLPERLFPVEGVACCHGSPWNALEGYVYPDAHLEEFIDYPQSSFFLGHTHRPMVRRISDKMILNPGSLGQPRNGGWPTYAVVDQRLGEIRIEEVFYDKGELLKRIDEVGDRNPYLKEVLKSKCP